MARDSVAPNALPRSELPLIAIIGRPNVGKSTLFNRLTGSRRAIVGDEAGITRDRLYGVADWNGRQIRVVDTGGIVPDDREVIPEAILRQARVAVAEASVVVLVVDARVGITPLDSQLAALARLAASPVFVAANKVDTGALEAEAAEFQRWGMDVFPISAEHGNGVGELLDAVLDRVPPLQVRSTRPRLEEGPDQSVIDVAIIGRPNVGKSSLVNRLMGEERMIVSPIPGTTRDAVDSEFVSGGSRFRLIDTAGIRRKGKTELAAEKLSVIMARRHLERADVGVLLIDGVEGPTALDAAIGGYAHEAGAGLIIAINKWDLVERSTEKAKELERRVREMMKFAGYATVVFVSTKTGHGLHRLLELVGIADHERRKRISTAELNRFFEKNLDRPRATTTARGSTRVLYITQAAVKPPTFVLFTTARNPREALHFSYERYVENRLRDEFGFACTPIRIKQKRKKPRQR